MTNWDIFALFSNKSNRVSNYFVGWVVFEVAIIAVDFVTIVVVIVVIIFVVIIVVGVFLAIRTEMNHCSLLLSSIW